MNDVIFIQFKTQETYRISTVYFEQYDDAMDFLYNVVFKFEYTLVKFSK